MTIKIKLKGLHCHQRIEFIAIYRAPHTFLMREYINYELNGSVSKYGKLNIMKTKWKLMREVA